MFVLTPVTLVIILFFRLISACTIENGTVIPDSLNTGHLPCIECANTTYMIDGVCQILPSSSLDPFAIVQSLCTQDDLTLKCKELNGKCVASGFGVRCQECSGGNGFLYLDTDGLIQCQCYVKGNTVGRFCQTSDPSRIITPLNTTLAYHRIDCIPHQSPVLGFFRDTVSCLPPYGPPPGQLVPDPTTFPQLSCNTLGETDKNGYFFTCSDGGSWNITEGYCDCFPSRNAQPIDGYPTKRTCSGCFGFWGGPACGAIYFPNRITGEDEECAGNGIWSNGTCNCFQNATAGFWDLEEVTMTFQRTLGSGVVRPENHTVSVCDRCKMGYVGSDCKTFVGVTNYPTISPSKAPSEFVWHPGTDGLCYPCPKKIVGNYFVDPISRMDVTSLSNQSSCFPNLGVTVFNETIQVESGLELDEMLTVGNEFCYRLNSGCLFFQITDNVTYSFYNESDIFKTPSSNSLLVHSCLISSSPTRRPTKLPTSYPQAL